MKKNDILFPVLCLACLFAVILTYSNHFHNSFQFDDSHTIVNNASLRDVRNIPLFFQDNRTTSSLPVNQGYRPVTTTTLAIDYWLSKGLKSTFYFHLSTFIWYVLLCVLLYFLYLKIINTALAHEWNRYIALFAAAWYGLHTVNAETINYIIQRAEVLSTVMVVAGMVIYAYLPTWRKYYLYLIPVIVGILAKEPAAMFAPLLFFYIMFFEKNLSVRDLFKPDNFIQGIKASLAAFVACILFLYLVIKMVSAQPWLLYGASRFHYLITQPFVILYYFITFFFPFNLSADTDWKAISNVFDFRVIVGTLFIVAMLFVVYRTSKRKQTRPVSFGIIWFFLALAPSSSFVPLAEVMNDHRMFFPFIGLMLSVCWALGLFIIKYEKSIKANYLQRAVIIIVALGLLGGYAYGTHQRNKVWHTGESLWYDVTVKSPGNGRGLMNYGLTQMEKGNYQRALEYFEKALPMTPHYAYLHINLGILKGAMNQPVEAEKYFRNGIQYGPNNPASYFFYARWLKGQNRIDEAVNLLRKALQISPSYNPAQSLFSEILANPKGFKTPLEQAEEVVKVNPTPENYLNLSLQYHRVQRFKDSIDASKKALKINPDYFLAYNNICAAYNDMKMWDKAIDACEKGLRINPGFQLMKNNLARAKSQKTLQK